MLIFPKAGSALMLLTFDWKNQGRENRCCVNVRILGELICSHSTIHSLLNCMRIRRKWENHSSDRLELDLTFGKTLKESSLNDERMQELNLISSILDVCCLKFLFIGPESDHWLCLSVTHSLTDSLTHCCLVDLMPVNIAVLTRVRSLAMLVTH